MENVQNLQIYKIAPRIPEKLEFLETLSNNLWWSWHRNANDLFRRINPELWAKTKNNPIQFLNMVKQDRLVALSEDEGYLLHLKEVEEAFNREMNDSKNDGQIAYFSLEFGIHGSLKIYSGGLGILSGDHLKSASDLNYPLVAVGLMYDKGYFTQFLDNDGWQQEDYPVNDPQYLPVKKVLDKNNRDLTVSFPLPNGICNAGIWEVNVGRVKLFLLDTNIKSNTAEMKEITSRLYGGDQQMRIRQELLIGIGGFKVLKQLGYKPKVYHINEGHAAFLNVARVNDLIQSGKYNLQTAEKFVKSTSVFTTHTPVPAGNETFTLKMIHPFLEALNSEMDVSPDTIYQWSNILLDSNTNFHDTRLSMTVMGLKMSFKANGVSKLHGSVSRKMWKDLWPNHPFDEVPIDHITNGIHVPTWISDSIAQIINRYMGPKWDRGKVLKTKDLEKIDYIPDEVIWQAHCLDKSRFIYAVRDHIEKSLKSQNAPLKKIDECRNLLNDKALTIGFARRFATYKRATLLLKDIERLKKICQNKEFPVQIVFAGKAHPADDAGKKFIQEIYRLSQSSDFKGKIVFIENYDMFIAKKMIAGVDIWLNTPRRPYEASGTSGMKAAANGILNVSILDGWWDEGYREGKNGWAIGKNRNYSDEGHQDYIDSQSLYNLIENQLKSNYYDRSEGNIPHKWVKMMKESMKSGVGEFSSLRMVADYFDQCYKPAIEFSNKIEDNGSSEIQSLTEKYHFLNSHWEKIKINHPKAEKNLEDLHSGDSFLVEASIYLDKISPDDVNVEVYYGSVNHNNEVVESNHINMKLEDATGENWYQFSQSINCDTPGRFGFTVRVTPKVQVFKDYMPGMITWPEKNGQNQ